MSTTSTTERKRVYHGWIVAAITCLGLIMVFGGRFSLGLFLPFLPEALDASASSVSLVFALSMLAAGIFQPVAGILADRFGSRFVFLMGLAFGGAAFAGVGISTHLWQVGVFMSLAGGIAFACVSPVLATSLMTQWFARQRGRALGVVTSGGKVAMIVLVPLLTLTIALYGWRAALIALGFAIWTVIPLVWFFVRSSPEEMGLHPDGDTQAMVDATPTSAPASDAARHSKWSIPLAMRTLPFWLLTIVLFGNGFIMNLVFLHLPSYILNLGYSQAFAAGGLVLLGAVGIAGNMVIGTLSDLFNRKHVLCLLFAARGLVTLLLIISPNPVTLAIFVIVFGLLGYGAIAVIGSLTAHYFGRASVGTIMGAAYVLNQIGGAAGIYAGGLAVDLTGSYEAALIGAVVVSLVACAAGTFMPKDSLPMPLMQARALAVKARH